MFTDAANYINMVNTDKQLLNESYSRYVQGQGVNQVPNCAFSHSSYDLWYHCNCQDNRPAVYEYPAKASNFTSRGGMFPHALLSIFILYIVRILLAFINMLTLNNS